MTEPDFLVVDFERERRVEGRSLPRADERRVGQMRRIVAARLRFWRLDRLVDDLLLIVSELVTNALWYGEGESVCLRLSSTSQAIRLSVEDGSPKEPQLNKAPGLDAEGGRGLFLVEAFVTELGGTWGSSEDGTTTWCEVPLTPERVGPAPLPESSR
ncbi:ATP-binding protein [Streptomyces sp. NPDC000878]